MAQPFNDPIAQTLLLPLYAKAIESQQPNPILSDPSAVRIVAQLDFDFSPYRSKKNTVGTAIRAHYLDNQARQFIAQHPKAIIVNVGCGLDARAQRIGQTAQKAHFYQVDITEVIAIRRQLLPAQSNETFITGSILNTDWLDHLAQQHPNRPFLFIIEGVLMYFSESDNRKLLTAIADRFNGATLCFDMASSFISRHSDKHATVGQTQARFKFGIDNPKIIETWHNKLQLIAAKPYGEFAENKRAGLLHYLMMKYIPFMHHCFSLLTYQVIDPKSKQAT